MFSPGTDSGLCYLNGPGTPKQWTVARRHLGRLPSHQEGEKGRTKILREFSVYILQVSWTDGRVTRLISAAAAHSTEPAQR